MAGMPCAEMMAAGLPLDPDQPTLCMQHCQFGSTTQVVDHVPAVFAPVTAFPALFTVSGDDRLDLGLRPYKPGMKLSQALHILSNFRKNGHIDPDLFDVFIKQKVYLRYAEQYLEESQIDDPEASLAI